MLKPAAPRARVTPAEIGTRVRMLKEERKKVVEWLRAARRTIVEDDIGVSIARIDGTRGRNAKMEGWNGVGGPVVGR